jgi:hypothetical protein
MGLRLDNAKNVVSSQEAAKEGMMNYECRIMNAGKDRE